MLILEFIALILGISITTILEFLTFRFLKDFYIDSKENGILKKLSMYRWVALLIYILMNVIVYLSQPSSEIVIMELIVAVVILINTGIAQLKILPVLHKYRQQNNTLNVAKVYINRKISFGQSTMNIFSWYYLFYLNFSIDGAYTFNSLLSNYIFVLIGVLITTELLSYIYDKYLDSQINKRDN